MVATVIPSASSRAARLIVRHCRRVLGVSGLAPVVLIPGRVRPRITGERGGHFTRGGSPISHPSGYARRGWSNMVYRCSTRRIEVGALYAADLLARS